MADIFRRVELKYIIDKKQYDYLMNSMKEYIVEDEYKESTICNIYFDTANYDLISHSITKPYFKEKIRLRSYNIPSEESIVFLEIKRKCDKIVSKRRIQMKLKDFENYKKNKNLVQVQNNQIKSELDYYFNRYNLEPKVFLAYNRIAYYEKNNPNFRLTFDSNIIAREDNLKLNSGIYGYQILEGDKYIMELKTLESLPFWMVKLLDKLELSTCGFSKYGEAYTQQILCMNDVESCVI